MTFEGPTRIGRLSVLGKGFAGMVVRVRSMHGEAALKIRRADSRRDTMDAEAVLLRHANALGVGPRLLSYTRNCILMEYVDGISIRKWLAVAPGPDRVGPIIRRLLTDCFMLDMGGLDHGELVDISDHVMITDRPVIIDFESGSLTRRVANVTSTAQTLFVARGMSELVRRSYMIPPIQDAIGAMREYKRRPSRESFKELLDVLNL